MECENLKIGKNLEFRILKSQKLEFRILERDNLEISQTLEFGFSKAKILKWAKILNSG